MGHVYLTFNGIRLKFDSDFLKFPEEESAFTTTWNITTEEETLTVPLTDGVYDDCRIDWGDGGLE